MKVDKRRRVTPAKLKRMQQLRGKGMTYQRIAKVVNLSYLTVYKYLNQEKYEKTPVEAKENESQMKKAGFFESLKSRLGL